MQYLMHAKFVELTQTVKDRLSREEGATAVEYGVMVAAIIAVIISVVFVIGTKVETAFNTVNSELT